MYVYAKGTMKTKLGLGSRGEPGSPCQTLVDILTPFIHNNRLMITFLRPLTCFCPSPLQLAGLVEHTCRPPHLSSRWTGWVEDPYCGRDISNKTQNIDLDRRTAGFFFCHPSVSHLRSPSAALIACLFRKVLRSFSLVCLDSLLNSSFLCLLRA